VIKDLKAMPEASTLGVMICKRLQLMMYNIIYRLMFNSWFESVDDDPLYVKLKALMEREADWHGALSTTLMISFPSCTHSWRVSRDLSGGQGHTTGSLQRLLHQGAQVICKLGFVAIMLSF
jgi:hypothetical protein